MTINTKKIKESKLKGDALIVGFWASAEFMIINQSCLNMFYYYKENNCSLKRTRFNGHRKPGLAHVI
jgi:hypothetical protein